MTYRGCSLSKPLCLHVLNTRTMFALPRTATQCSRTPQTLRTKWSWMLERAAVCCRSLQRKLVPRRCTFTMQSPIKNKMTCPASLAHTHTYMHTHSFTHSFTHSLLHSLTPSLTPSLTHSLTLTHSFTYSHTHTCTLTLSLTPSLTHSFTHSFTHSLLHSLTHTLTHSLTRCVTSGGCVSNRCV